MNKNIAILAINIYILLVTSTAYSQNTEPKKPANPLLFLSNLFNSRSSNLSKLLDEEKYLEADAYINSEKTYFLIENRKENSEQLHRLERWINRLSEPYMEKSIEELLIVRDSGDSKQWIKQKEILTLAEGRVSAYHQFSLINEIEFSSPKLLQLESAITSTKLSLASESINNFIKFNHDSSNIFFASYPIKLSDKFLSENIESLKLFVSELAPGQIKNFKIKYKNNFQQEGDFDQLLLDRYMKESLKNFSVQPPISVVLEVINNATSAGFNVKSAPEAKLSFVELDMKLIKIDGPIEFPIRLDADLPFVPSVSSIESILENSGTIVNTVILVDTTLSKATRQIIEKTDVPSKFISGYRTDPNPEYQVARSKVFEAQNGLSNIQSQNSVGLAAAILHGIAVGLWTNRLHEAQQALSSTPSTVNINEYKDYKYSTSNITATRTASAHYYVIDKNLNNYFKGSLEISENKSFKISYNIDTRDPDATTIGAQFNKESDIVDYEKSPITLQESLILKNYLKNNLSTMILRPISELRNDMLVDKNNVLTAFKSTQYSATPLNDKRFDSVVIVNNPNGALGAGFFVAPDLVLTNYHVIEGSKFVEMKLYNGLETFGKIIKTDVRLDLALVQVQTRGAPVILYKQNNIDLGATVEAIGHPRGLTFTITRGIISAVRKKSSVYGVGGKDVLFVQTDAAINPGNSGGPLFLGDKLIGVNNNKMVSGSEGLGFAIHYSEIEDFLKD